MMIYIFIYISLADPALCPRGAQGGCNVNTAIGYVVKVLLSLVCV